VEIETCMVWMGRQRPLAHAALLLLECPVTPHHQQTATGNYHEGRKDLFELFMFAL